MSPFVHPIRTHNDTDDSDQSSMQKCWILSKPKAKVVAQQCLIRLCVVPAPSMMPRVRAASSSTTICIILYTVSIVLFQVWFLNAFTDTDRNTLKFWGIAESDDHIKHIQLKSHFQRKRGKENDCSWWKQRNNFIVAFSRMSHFKCMRRVTREMRTSIEVVRVISSFGNRS